MKKIILTCGICLVTFLTYAQEINKDLADFNTYSATINTKVQDASKNKNYPVAASLLTEWLGVYDNLSSENKKSFQSAIPSVYYTLACYAALQGQTKPAITYFEKAIDAGYLDYANTVKDTDLNSLRANNKFKADLLKMREKGDYGFILKNSGNYNTKEKAALPHFTYQAATSPELVALKNQFNLDSVSGKGDEISRIKNLLYWTHNVVPHNGNSNNPKIKNAADLIAVCKKDNRGLNCRMMATILKDVFQAEGFQSRIVTCMPKDTADFDCHVITVVWAKTLNKWVWMDPTFNAYVSDDKGNLLSIEEVRTRLVNGSALVLNEDANWNNKNKETKAHYLDYYMSKNLFWIQCPVKSVWDMETRKPGMQTIEYLNLYPGTFNTIHQAVKKDGDMLEYATNNPAYFWQKPTALDQ